MAVPSGKQGTVKIGTADLVEVTKWTFDAKSAVSQWASNSSSGYKKSVDGVRSASGTIEVKVDTAGTMDLVAGSSATLLLHVDATGSNYYSVPAVVSASALECDINDGEVVSATYSYEANGEWTPNGALATS